MTISLIVAAAENDVIGRTGTVLPWRLPADLAHFKQVTLGRPVIMGRKTYDTIGRPLPGRRNIIISRNDQLEVPDCQVVANLDDALEAAKADGRRGEVFVIGGGQIYAAAEALADRIYLTRVHARPDGDAYFRYNPAQWHETTRDNHPADDENEYPFTFLTLDRI